MLRVRSAMMGWMAVGVAACLMAWSAPDSAHAGPPAGMPTGGGDDGEKPDAGKPDPEKPDFPPFDEVAKDHKEIAAPQGETGFFQLYYNEKTDHMLAVIPKSLIGKNFIMASSIAGGPVFAGWMWGDGVVRWEEMDKTLVLIEPDLRQKSGEKTNLEDVIRRTYTDMIVLSTTIVSKKDGNPVIDLDSVFKRDVAGLARIFDGSMDSSLSRWAKKKVFPNNVELAVDAAMMEGDGTGRRAQVHFSLSKLPENDYQPREADNRVGYFLTAVKD